MLLTPKYIFSQDFSDLEEYFLSRPHTEVSFRKGEYLWAPDEPYHKVYYILDGTVQNYIEHENGHQRILSFHSSKTVFPMFHYKQYKLENGLLASALTHTQTIEFTQEQFSDMFDDNSDLRRHVIDWFSSYTNLLLYEAGHQEYNDSFVKLCNLLYLLLISENGRSNYLEDLTQESLADILGISLINVTRSLTQLRQEGIIQTTRKKITIINADKLIALCSGETL